MHIRKGDNVIILTGREKGKQGKVVQVIKERGRVVVEGLMLRRRHVKPKRQGEKGQVLSIPSSMDISNVMVVCSRCGKPTKVGYSVKESGKVRVCKKCKEVI